MEISILFSQPFTQKWGFVQNVPPNLIGFWKSTPFLESDWFLPLNAVHADSANQKKIPSFLHFVGYSCLKWNIRMPLPCGNKSIGCILNVEVGNGVKIYKMHSGLNLTCLRARIVCHCTCSEFEFITKIEEMSQLVSSKQLMHRQARQCQNLCMNTIKTSMWKFTLHYPCDPHQK